MSKGFGILATFIPCIAGLPRYVPRSDATPSTDDRLRFRNSRTGHQ